MTKISSLVQILFVIFPLCFSSFFPTSVQEKTYNSTLALKFWNLCMGSYCPISQITNWDLGFVSQLFPMVTDITVIINSTSNACGYTAYNPAEDEVLIIFRGTEPLDLQNWIDDLDTYFTPYDQCEGCEVHEGFYGTYLDIQPKILAAAGALFKKYPNSRKLVAGHSLGGALAVHAGVDIINHFGEIDEFYTYGSPRVGNAQFAQWSNSKVKGNFNSRITHNRDPVPHLPLESWGFLHVDNEVYYSDDTNYVICNKGEDDNCSNRDLININVLDHLNYMGQDIVPYYLGCHL